MACPQVNNFAHAYDTESGNEFYIKYTTQHNHKLARHHGKQPVRPHYTQHYDVVYSHTWWDCVNCHTMSCSDSEWYVDMQFSSVKLCADKEPSFNYVHKIQSTDLWSVKCNWWDTKMGRIQTLLVYTCTYMYQSLLPSQSQKSTQQWIGVATENNINTTDDDDTVLLCTTVCYNSHSNG